MIRSQDNAPYDVVIIGGGPGGSTTGALLKKYAPELRVLILEKERFPREHVGESQLPPISAVLQEMGCWDKVEAANFPIKIGATYTWGDTTDPWDFEFLPIGDIKPDEARPAKYEGWRVQTAFQVERSIYDKILLDHAAELGCEVREETRVAKVHAEGDRVTGLELETGEVVAARHYIDATGAVATLRRAMGVKIDAPTLLRNVAFWDYWENAEWAEEIGVGATRVHIRSLGYGWLWFIPLGPTRTSIGLVCPADHYKQTGKRPEEIYLEAIQSERFVSALTASATRDGPVRSTTDWSFVVDRTYGENWFLVGESAGFADPILAAGLTLTQTGARELAYTILELERGELDRDWLLERYDELQLRRVRQHMRFADYWYSANGYFDDIRENCSAIAKESGLKLDAADAFRWLAQGGLGDDAPGQVGVGGMDVAGVKQMMQRFSGSDAKWTINGKNTFKLNLVSAKETTIGKLVDGRIHTAPCYVRGKSRLPLLGVQGLVVEALRASSDAEGILEHLRAELSKTLAPEHVPVSVHHAIQTLEVMANDYWVICGVKKNKPVLNVTTPEEGSQIHTHDANSPSARRIPATEA
ncbi:MAG: NAD(P)/FAD-dependent oxidoreductase [Phycisphaerales bacterium]|nr:MAG: NAD(P)/FAD-dependent oxidoreductase [Phycisphaerales bacterium]